MPPEASTTVIEQMARCTITVLGAAKPVDGSTGWLSVLNCRIQLARVGRLVRACVQHDRYGGLVLDLNGLDLEEIANALADQTDYEHRYLINPETGEVVFWTSDTGIDGQTPVDLDELDLICIDPLPSHVWYQDMADFAERVSDERAGRRLARAIQGKGAFRRFKDELHEEYPHLLTAWYAFRDTRARHRAAEWLADNSLVDNDAATRFRDEHPEPDVP
jgi:hypothetical protein